MTRYIDPEELKANLGEPPENLTSSAEEIQALNDFYMFQTLIEAQPTADVVEVVRCNDCKHWYDAPAMDEYNSCELDALIRHKDFYCANAERRADE